MANNVKKIIERQRMVMIDIEKTKWYQSLLDDLKTFITERVFRARMEIIEMKHEIGKRILEEELNFKRANYGEKIIEKIANDLEVSRTDLYLCVEFARKYPIIHDVDNLPEGKNISWTKIKQKYLPEASEKTQEPGKVHEIAVPLCAKLCDLFIKFIWQRQKVALKTSEVNDLTIEIDKLLKK